MEKEKQLTGMCGSSKNRKDKGENRYGYIKLHIINSYNFNYTCDYDC